MRSALVLKCEKVDFSIFQNYLTIYPKDESLKTAAFETSKDGEEDDFTSYFESLDDNENNEKEIYTYNEEHAHCHHDNLNKDNDHIHYKFKNALTLDTVTEILKLSYENKVISSLELVSCKRLAKAYLIPNTQNHPIDKIKPNDDIKKQQSNMNTVSSAPTRDLSLFPNSKQKRNRSY